MTDSHSDHKPELSTHGSIAYLDAEKLLRPTELPRKSYGLVIIFVLIAALVAAFIVVNVADGVYFSKKRTSENVTTMLTRSIDYQFPQLKDYVANTDAIYDDITSSYTTVTLASEEDYPNGGFDLFKLPSDASFDSCAAALAGGIKSMNALQASQILKGGWRLTMDLSNYTDLKMRYSDFSSNTLEAAIQNALEHQGLTGDDVELTGEGVDESGNTYKTGTIEIDDETYFWRISTIWLSDVYDIEGLPETAVYVGIRFTN